MTDPALAATLPEILRQADSLPSLPAVALEVLRLTDDPDTTIEDLAEVIMRDPALTAKLLRVSNSAMFNPGGSEVVSMTQAAMTLGLGAVRLMSLSFSLVSSLPMKDATGTFRLGKYWERSLCAAVAGQELARETGRAAAPEAFTCGLLAPIGQLVLSQCLTETYQSVLDAAKGSLPTPELERAKLGFDHAVVGAALLEAWGLPKRLHQIVRYRNEPGALPDDAPPATRELCALVHLAELATRVLCDEEKGHALRTLAHEAQHAYGLSLERVNQLVSGLGDGIRAAADLLSLDVASQDYGKVLERARMQVVQLSLSTSASLQAAERRATSLEARNKELATQANTDRLTGLGNRAYFDSVLAREIKRRMEKKVPLALGLLMIDVDHFKKFNDTYGHQLGDEVLAAVGGVLLKHTRDSDATARYGGEEFAVIAPQATTDGLRVLAERLRYRVSTLKIEDPKSGDTPQVTISIGAACLSDISSPEDGKTLIKLADHFLYQAKKRGRNRCEFYPKSTKPTEE